MRYVTDLKIFPKWSLYPHVNSWDCKLCFNDGSTEERFITGMNEVFLLQEETHDNGLDFVVEHQAKSFRACIKYFVELHMKSDWFNDIDVNPVWEAVREAKLQENLAFSVDYYSLKNSIGFTKWSKNCNE